MTKLPRSIDELRGLRAARWIRESTRGQFDHHGPDSQREQQDRFLERYGLVDTGLVFEVAQSGKTVWQSPAMTASIRAARAGEYDVLLSGYSDRWQRNLRRTLELLEDHLHPAGVALAMCDRRILSSDPRDWDELVAEATASERYSRRLGERITDGYAAKFRTLSDQAGNAPLGFRRSATPPHVLEVDPSTIDRGVRVFERYAGGSVSLRELAAETGIAHAAVRMMVANPIYNGWVRRHRRTPGEQLRAAAWRDDPPVSDELWAAVQDARRRRHTGGGAPTPRHDHLLNGLLHCACGRRITAEMHESGRRYRHHDRCTAWATSTIKAERFDFPISEQLRRARPTAAWLAQLRRLAAAEKPQPAVFRRRQLERELADKALLHARGALTTAAYLAEHERINGAIEHLGTRREGDVDPERAARWLRDVNRAWEMADLAARHRLAAAVYSRITVTPDAFVGVELTSMAEAHWVSLAMPERVLAARPAGDERPRNTIIIPVAGRREWLRLARSA